MSFSPAAAWHRTECGLSTDDVAKASGGTGIRDQDDVVEKLKRKGWNLLRVVKDRSAASECVEHVRPAPVLEFVAHAPTADVPQSHFMDHVADIPSWRRGRSQRSGAPENDRDFAVVGH